MVGGRRACQNERVLRVGLTGGIASGKSTVADLLHEQGALVIDADVLAREAVAPGSTGLAEVIETFGPDVLDQDGALDRPALGRVVFADPEARTRLEAIIHPRVRARARELEAQADPSAVVVHVIPLLVETGQADDFDVLVVVDVDPQVQRDRLMARNGLSAEEADRRIAAQATRAARLSAADVVLHNDGTPDELAAQVAGLWRHLTDAAASAPAHEC